MIAVWLWGSVLAHADEFAAQPLGEPLVGEGWRCPPPGSSCSKPDRVASLRGVWTASLDEGGRVQVVAFSAFWVPHDMPERSGQPPSQTTRAPLQEAMDALQRINVGYLARWTIEANSPQMVVYRRDDEQRTFAVWQSELTDEQGNANTTASLHVQRELLK